MSEITVTVERIEAIEPHPNADKLEIAKVAGVPLLLLLRKMPDEPLNEPMLALVAEPKIS